MYYVKSASCLARALFIWHLDTGNRPKNGREGGWFFMVLKIWSNRIKRGGGLFTENALTDIRGCVLFCFTLKSSQFVYKTRRL